MAEITKISSKGQVVIPARLRKELGLEEGNRFVVDSAGSTIVLRKLSVPDALEEFDKIARKGEQFAMRKRIKSEEDFNKIVHERRKKRHFQSSS